MFLSAATPLYFFLRCALVVVALAALCAVAARADDWPQFRGPGRDDVWHEKGILTSFPPGGLIILWRQPVGVSLASPVVADGRVFVTDAELSKPNAKERIQCFDAATGKPLWAYDYAVTYPDYAFNAEQGAGSTATPIVEADRVYVIGRNGAIHCLNAVTGALVWENDLRKRYEIREMTCTPSPLIDGALLIVFTGAKPGASVMALDKMTGKEVWKALDDSASNSSPIIIEYGGARQLIVWSDDSLSSLNPANGAVYWRMPMVTSNNDSIPTPVFRIGRLLVAGLMLKLNSDKPDATILWPESKAAGARILSNTSNAIIQGDYVYSAKNPGELVCLQADTGKLVWKNTTVTELKNGASIHLTPAGDVTFLFTDRGELIVARLTPEGYEEKGRAKLIEPTMPYFGKNYAWTPPAYANRCVFARNDSEIVCASLADK